MVGARRQPADEVAEAGEGSRSGFDVVGRKPAGGEHPAAALPDGDQFNL